MSKLWAIIWTGCEDTVLYQVEHTHRSGALGLCKFWNFSTDVGEVCTGEEGLAEMC